MPFIATKLTSKFLFFYLIFVNDISFYKYHKVDYTYSIDESINSGESFDKLKLYPEFLEKIM